MDIRAIAADIVAREGGFVDDPADPGGATQWGVTLGTLQRLHRDVTGDGRVDVADVRALTQDQAIDLLLAEYFRAPGLDRLPPALQASVFDMYVNAGRNAVRLLQQLVTKMGFPCDDDGILGPQTLACVTAAAAAAPDHIVDAYGIERRNYYYRLADARPASRKFARARDGGKGGWILRAETFIGAKYRLSDAEHRARVQAWG